MSIREQWSKVDPRDAELLALKTLVTNLESKRAVPPTALTTDGKKPKKGIREPHLDWSKVEGTKIDSGVWLRKETPSRLEVALVIGASIINLMGNGMACTVGTNLRIVLI